MLGIANILTLVRISLVPVLILVFYLPFNWSNIAAAIIFALASFTDFLDGLLARKLEQTSSFGAFCDPVADKLIVVTTLILLVGEYKTVWFTLPAIIIVGREISISALREWLAKIGSQTSVPVNFVGQVKTFLQMLAIIILLCVKILTIDNYMVIIGFILLYSAALLTLWSMFIYLKAAWPSLWHQDNNIS